MKTRPLGMAGQLALWTLAGLMLAHVLALVVLHQNAQVLNPVARDRVMSRLATTWPGVLRHLNNLATKDPTHLAHEFLTDHWHPQHSVDVHREVGLTGLTYVGSADAFNNLDVSLSIPGQLQSAIQQTRIPALAETLKDMARNSHQRMDFFQRQPRPLSQEEYAARLGAMELLLLPGAPTSGPITFSTPIGPIQEGPRTLCTALLQRLAAGPASIAELAGMPAVAGQTGLLLQTLQLMMMQEFAHPSSPSPIPANEGARKLTRWFEQNGISLAVLAACGTAIPR